MMIQRAETAPLDQGLRDGLCVGRRQSLVTELDELTVEPVERQTSSLKVDVRGTLLESQAE